MLLIIPIDIILVLFLVFLFIAVSGVYVIAQNILSIIWNISIGCFIFAAVVLLIWHILCVIGQEPREKIVSAFYLLFGLVKVFFLGIGWDVIYEAFSLGMGVKKVKNYVLIGKVSWDIRILCLVIMILVIVISDVALFVASEKKLAKIKIALYSVDIILIVSVLAGTTYIGLKSNIKNSLSEFNYESPEYVSKEPTDIYQYVSLADNDKAAGWWYPFGAMFITGEFQSGTKLYLYDGESEYLKERHKNGKEYVLVTDKNNIGYVNKNALKELVYYEYFIKKGVKVYGSESANIGKQKTDEVIIKIRKKTKIEKTGTTDVVYNSSTSALSGYTRYTEVKLPDGTVGFVESSLVQTIRKKKG